MTQFECSKSEWKEVDRRLASIAKQRAALDAEEARWLREAVRLKIWREVGCASLLDYLERRLGYAPRTAQDRVRVAMALAELPSLEAALAGGMPYTAVRELTRVVTRETEQEWIDACRDTSVREVEAAVAGHRKGSRPSDPAEPDLVARSLTFEEILPSTMALLRQARQKAQAERGVHLSDNDLLALVLGTFIEGGRVEGDPGRAKFQIATIVCERCEQGWQEGAGRRFAMEKADVERAKCDAQHIGSLDGDPERATQDVPPSVRRFVFRRDGGTCSVPGCRSTTHLEVHHIEPRARGGKHDPENLIVLCDGCHSALHRGHLQISGTAGSLVVRRRHSFEMRSADRAYVGVPAAPEAEVRSAANSHAIPKHEVRSESASDSQPATRHDVRAHVGASDSHTTSQHEVQTDSHATSHEVRSDEIRAHVGARSRFEQVAIRTQALDALVRLDFKRHEARAAVDAAAEHFEQTRTTATLESFLRIALSKCPRPRRG